MTVRQLIKKYFSNNYSEKVQREFFFWLKDSMGEDEKDAVLKNIWDELNVSPNESMQRSYEVLQSKIKPAIIPQPRKLSLVQRYARVAAVLALPILSACIIYLMVENANIRNQKIELVECIVPDGEIRTITLPDSSVVKVNSGSILIYPRQFAKTRDIFLNGEAYFRVTKDATKPFVVKTTDLEVEVLGTVFNISAYTNSENQSTALESGKVNVTFKNIDQESITLYPSEEVVYNRGSGIVTKSITKIENVIAWTNGNMIIQDMPMNELIKVIERRYAIKVYLNSNKFQNESITMKITDGENIEEFMSIVQYLVPHLKYKIEDDKLYIY